MGAEPRVREDERAQRLRRRGEVQRRPGVERLDALPRRRQRPVRHGHDRAPGQEAPSERTLHVHAARRVARVEYEVTDATGDEPRIPALRVGVVASPPAGGAEPHGVARRIGERRAHAGSGIPVERRHRQAPRPRLAVVHDEPVGRGPEHRERRRGDGGDV